MMIKTLSLKINYQDIRGHHLNVNIPFFQGPVSCGFPSPADDYLETPISLDKSLIKNPASTFFVRAKGDSMINLGIQNHDILVVDRSLTPKTDDIILAIIHNEFTVKQLKKYVNQYYLAAANPHYKPIKINEEGCEVWGVVTHVVHTF